ncbi:helix-turn-helix domain-containing protein [Bacillus sp. JJ1474]|uniref:helix-turn-helix domain-containing protein n=1 Tax=Bacillus sp. JJ1474 TaxID=3122955 RepID=UPI003000BF8D
MDEISAKVKDLRLKNSATLKELSEKTGLSVGFLSQVERGTSSLAITSLKKIADAFEVNMTYFFEDQHGQNYAVKKADQKTFKMEGSPSKYVRLSGEIPGRQLEALRVTLAPNYKDSEVFSHHGEEIHYVLEGTVIFRVGDKEYLLSAGESIHFPSEKPHQWENPLNQETVLYSVLTPVIF